MTALFQPAELHSSTTQTETGRWRNRRGKPKKLQTEILSTFAVCLIEIKLIDVVWLKSLPKLSRQGRWNSFSSSVVTCLLTCVISLALSVPLMQTVLQKHRPVAALLRSRPSVRLRSLSTVLQGIRSPHSRPVSNLCPRIPQVGSRSWPPHCLYLVIRVSASRKWLRCPPSSIRTPSPRKLRRCWQIITLVRETADAVLQFCPSFLDSLPKIETIFNSLLSINALETFSNPHNCFGGLWRESSPPDANPMEAYGDHVF